MCLMGVKEGWWLVRRESLKFLSGKVTFPAWLQEGELMPPAPISRTEPHPTASKSELQTSLGKHTMAYYLVSADQSYKAGCEFTPWLATVCRTKAEAGQMADTTTELFSGCGPTRSMITWESAEDGSQLGWKG